MIRRARGQAVLGVEAGVAQTALIAYREWSDWIDFIFYSEVIERSEGIAIVRLASALYRSGRPTTLEIVEDRLGASFVELGHSRRWGLSGRWEIEPNGASSRISFELELRSEFFQVLAGRRLREVVASLLRELPRRVAVPAIEQLPAMQIFRARGELVLQYRGHTYRLLEEEP